MNKVVIQDKHIYIDGLEIFGVLKYDVAQEANENKKITLTFYGDVSLGN
ncbi:hypothetical protein [Pediococcus acidilactici]|nr:hypothetical protein [Pediococcus acidilactici]